MAGISTGMAEIVFTGGKLNEIRRQVNLAKW